MDIMSADPFANCRSPRASRRLVRPTGARAKSARCWPVAQTIGLCGAVGCGQPRLMALIRG